MRVPMLILALAATGLAGCASDTDSGPTATDGPAATPERMVPAPIYDNKTVTGSADPLNFVDGGICTTPTSNCVRYPFSVANTTYLDAELTWGLAANDFDFYVYEGATQVMLGASDVTTGPGTREQMAGELGAGEYEIVVVPWSVGQDTYHLKAVFS